MPRGQEIIVGEDGSVTISPGADFLEVIAEAKALLRNAQRLRSKDRRVRAPKTISFNFGGVDVTVGPDTDPERLHRAYEAAVYKRGQHRIGP